MEKITEKDSKYRHLDKMSTYELLLNINQEDKTVPHAIEKVIPNIEKLVDVIVSKMSVGGRLFYIGAGTSGRLGVVDASECPPTFGVPHDWVVGIIAGGDKAIRKSVENAEDDAGQAFLDLQEYDIDNQDIVIGIAASGTTPYVIGGLRECQKNNIITGCITSNLGAPMLKFADYPIACPVGPEFVTGSTRMKAGTSQKLILNMISTSVMVKLGRVVDNKMVDMQLSNDKLIDRGVKMVMQKSDLGYEEAKAILLEQSSVRKALDYLRNKN